MPTPRFSEGSQVVIPDRYGNNRGAVVIQELPHPWLGTIYRVLFHATGNAGEFTAQQMRVLKRRRSDG